MVDGDEVAEPAGKPFRLDGGRLVLGLGAWTHDDVLVHAPLFRWEESDEGIVERALFCPVENFPWRTVRDDLAVVHCGEPIEPARFVHVGGRNDHAHLWTTRPDRIDQLPELPARKRIDARSRLIENKEIRIVHQRATEADFLLHAA